MEILLSGNQDIFTVNFNVTSKTITISGCNNYPLDVSSLKEIYDVTAAGVIGLPNFNEFSWFRSNGLPIFVWGVNNLPAGAANNDTLNINLSIPQSQSNFTLWQKYAGVSAGSPGTFVGSETPTGAINSTNKSYTLANTPIAGAITLIYTPQNQPTQFLQYNTDFTVSGNTITLNTAPLTNSSLFALYYH